MGTFAAVFRKELTQGSNRRATYAGLIGFICAAWLFYGLAVADLFDRYTGHGVESVGRLYEAIREFGRVAAAGATAAFAVFLPIVSLVLAADSIAREVRRGTAVFLALLPPPALAVVAGKAAAAVFRVYLSFVMLMPLVTMIVVDTGGFGLFDAVVASFVILAQCALFAAIGAFAGTSNSGRTDAPLRAFGLGCLAYFISAVAIYGASRTGIGPLRFVAYLLSPAALSGPLTGGFAFNRTDAVVSAVLQMLAAGPVIMWAGRRLETNFPSLVGPAPKGGTGAAAPVRRRRFAGRPLSEFAGRFIPPGMTLRELHAWGSGSMALLPAVGFVVLVLMVVVAGRGLAIPALVLRDGGFNFSVLVAGLMVALVALVIQSSNRVAEEREARTLPLLSLTALGPRGILFGKAAGVFISQAPFLGAVLLLSIRVCVMGRLPVQFGVSFFLFVVALLAAAVTLGLYYSVASRWTALAVLAAAGSALLFFTGVVWTLAPGDASGDERQLSMILALAGLATSFAFPFLARRRRFGVVMHAAALAGISWAAFCLKVALAPEWSKANNSSLNYFFTPGMSGLAPVTYVPLLVLGVLAWMWWVMTATFDSQVRHDTQAA